MASVQNNQFSEGEATSVASSSIPSLEKILARKVHDSGSRLKSCWGDYHFIINPQFQYYDKFTQEHLPEQFAIAKDILEQIKRLEIPEFHDRYREYMINSMTSFIGNSNMTEKAGFDFHLTTELCEGVFSGQDIDAADIPSDELLRYIEGLIYPRNDCSVEEEVIRSRREVIQHAQALLYILHKIGNNDDDAILSEELLLETHRILCSGIPLPQSHTRHRTYAGEYRKHPVFAGTTQFCEASTVPTRMATFINDFNDDLAKSKVTKEIDPFFLAADACQDLVMIHPFADGNGRMCRLLGTALLFRYTGILVPFGEGKRGREQYLDVARVAGDPETEEIARGLLTRFILENGVVNLRKLREGLTLGIPEETSTW